MEDRCLPASRGISNPRYSGTPQKPRSVTPTGLSPSMVRHSRRLRLPNLGFLRGPCNPTSPGCYHPGFSLPSAAFGRPYSRHPCWFLFLRVLRCFNSPRSRSLRSAPNGAGSPIRGSWDLRMHAPPPGLSQLATPFVGAQAEPSTRWGNGYTGVPGYHQVQGLMGPSSSLGLSVHDPPGSWTEKNNVDPVGFEPTASALQGRRSPS